MALDHQIGRIARLSARHNVAFVPAGKTTALDTESERQIQQALETLMKGCTTIVIVHRLSTVVNADVIHAMDQGRLVQSGSHAELLAEGGRYAKLHAL